MCTMSHNLDWAHVRSVSGMAVDKFKQMLDQEMAVLPKNIARHLTENYSG